MQKGILSSGWRCACTAGCRGGDPSIVTVDKPDQFRWFTPEKLEAAAQLQATGLGLPDISREIPVISLGCHRHQET